MNDQSAIAHMLEGKKLSAAGNVRRLPECKLAVLGTFTLDYLPPFLVRAMSRVGVHATVQLADFNQWSQEILDEQSRLYAFQPDAVFIVTALEDVLPDLFSSTVNTTEDQLKRVEQQLASMRMLFDRLARRLSRTRLYVVIPAVERVPGEAVLDPTAPYRGQEAVEAFLSGLRRFSAEVERLTCVDWDYYTRRHGLA